MDIAPEIAWKDADAVCLSFDIDVVDPGYAPGTGTPGPGGMTPREALKAARMVAGEGLIGMDLVEIASPYDHSDVTSRLGARLIIDTRYPCRARPPGRRLTAGQRARAEADRNQAAGVQ
jgi:agmatinase